MTNDKNATQEAARSVRVPQRVPDFDPMKFARNVVNKAGEKVLMLDLKYKKAWFRRACPNGGVVLNPLRVTDQMAIFEARLFADTGDSNPLSSFIAARTADKSTGQQYIRAAQEDALNEALENAGFGLPLIPMSNDSEQEQAVQRPASVRTKPHTDEAQPPAPEETQSRKDTGTVTGTHAVVDIATAKPAGDEAQSADQPEQAVTADQPASDAASDQNAPPPAEEDAPITYTADMTVEEIRKRMTLEQAKKIKVQDGTCKGWTLEQVAKDRPPSLKWLKFTAPFADNVLKAAASIVLDDLELKKAG